MQTLNRMSAAGTGSTDNPRAITLNWVQIINSNTIYAVGNLGTFIKTTDGGNTWSVNSQVGSPDVSSTGGGATRVLNYGWFFDANTGIVAGQSLSSASPLPPPHGMVSRTTDAGNTWTYIDYNDTGGTVNCLYFIDSNTGFLCGGTRARVHKTTDAGLTWTDVSGNLAQTNTWNSVYAFDANNIVVATSANRIYTTSDGGTMWTLTTLPGSSATITDIYFKNVNTGYACGNGNYFAYTLNGGLSWTQSNPPSSVGQRRLKYSGGSVYLVGAYTEIYKSTDDGMNWSAINFIDGSNANQPTPFIMYGIDVNGMNMAVVGNAGIINLSNNAGALWSNKNYSVDNGGSNLYSSMVVSSDATQDNLPSGTIWLGPNGGGNLLYSSNGGANWTARTTSHTRAVYDIEFADANVGYICGGFPNNPVGIGEISKTTDGGNTWTYLNTLPAPMNTSQINALSFPDANTGYAAAFRSPFEGEYIYKTTDGGASWTQQPLETNPNGSVVNVQMINVNTGYALGNSGGAIYTTTNGGANWIKNTNSYVTSTAWSNMFIYSKDIIYLNGAGTSGSKKVVRSIDGGQTWTDLTGNLLSTATIFRTSWLNLKHGVAVGVNGYAAKTTDGGQTWTSSNTGGSTIVGVGFPNKNAWFTACDRNSSFPVWRKYDNLTSISLSVSLAIEGLWDGKPMDMDTVTIQLRNATTPYTLVEEKSELVNINGYATYEFTSASTGSYWLVVRHRNGLETWSAAPVALTAGGNDYYDFTGTTPGDAGGGIPLTEII